MRANAKAPTTPRNSRSDANLPRREGRGTGVNAKCKFDTAFIIVSIAALTLVLAPRADGSTRRTPATYRLAGLDGSETTLSSYRGEVVVVTLWTSWCAPCRKSLSVLNGWHEAWTSRGGRVVAISVDKDARRARRFVNDERLTLTVLHDGHGALVPALDISSPPCTLLLDRTGRVVTVVRSGSPERLDALRREAESLLKRPANAGIQSAGMGEAPAGNTKTGNER